MARENNPNITGRPADQKVRSGDLITMRDLDGSPKETRFDDALYDLGLAANGVGSINEIAVIGDSRNANGYNFDATHDGLNAYGWQFWVKSLSRGKYAFPADLNFAVSGYTSYQMAQRAQEAAECRAKVVFMFISTNDRSANWPFRAAAGVTNQTHDNVLSTIQTLLDAGKIVFLFTESPRGNSAFTAQRLLTPQLQIHQQVRQWMKSLPGLLGRPTLKTIDLYPVRADKYTATGDYLVSQSRDALHCNVNGACSDAQTILPHLDALGFPPARNFLPTDVVDRFDATNNPHGNIALNGLMTGTGGSKGTTGATGNVADNYTLTTDTSFKSGTLAIAASKVTTATGDWQQFVITGDSGAGTFPLFQMAATLDSLATLGNPATGQIGSVCEYEVDANNAFACIGLRTMLTRGGVNYQAVDGDNSIGPGPAVAVTGTLRTERLSFDGTETAIDSSILLRLVPSVTSVSLTVRVRNLAARITPSV